VNVTVFGASGGCGRWMVEVARAQGHRVTAFVRPEADYPTTDGVHVVRGSVLDASAVDRATTGADAVLSGLGLRRRHPNNPWSALVSPPDLISRATGNIVDACRRLGVPRVAVVSAGGVGDSAGSIPSILRFFIASSNVGVAYRDLARTEAILRDSTLDWMAVRPVTLADGPPTGRVAVVTRYTLASKISRGDVGAWMVGAIGGRGPFAHRTPLIAGR